MKEPKQIVWRYDGAPNSEEVEVDGIGDVELPIQGGVVNRKGKVWNVFQINKEFAANDTKLLPLYRISLMSG